MKRFANYILIGAFLLAAGNAGMKTQAQNDADLLRFSMLNPIGTARFNAMGGAFGALGANFTTLSTNPAGIGLYTRHEISLTGGLLSTSSLTNYYDKYTEMDNTRVSVPQGGGIFEVYRNTKTDGGLRHLQFGFGANRLKDFNSVSYARGINTQSSYMDYVTSPEVSARYDFSGDDQNLAHVGNPAYWTGLMDWDSIEQRYISFLGPGLDQKHIVQEKGNISELVFSFGGNVADKFYFGVTLGVPIVNYQQTSIIEEINPGEIESAYIPEGLVYFNSYRLKQDLKQTGSGVNLKLGVIFKPLDFFRVGLAFHTPTYYTIKEKSTVSMNTDMLYLVDGGSLSNYDSYSYDDFRYQLSTPAKGILSVGFLIKNFGAVSVDGELINYKGMRFDIDDIDEQNYMRDVVRESYKMAGVLRVGTEWKVSIVSLRAGYIWQSCPYKNEELSARWSDHTVTAGIGFALGRHCNLDFAFMGNFGKRTDDFYYLTDKNTGAPLVQPAKVQFGKYIYTLGFNYRF